MSAVRGGAPGAGRSSLLQCRYLAPPRPVARGPRSARLAAADHAQNPNGQHMTQTASPPPASESFVAAIPKDRLHPPAGQRQLARALPGGHEDFARVLA